MYRRSFCAVLVTLVTAAFYATTGLVVWRVAFALVPALIAAIGAAIYTVSGELATRQQQWVACACLFTGIAQSIFIVAKSGPYS